MDKDVENDKRRNKTLLLILGVATVLVALIGATFAYFTAVIRYENAPQSVLLTTLEVEGLEYTATGILSLTDASPDSNKIESKDFTIKNPNTTAVITYSMVLKTDINTFTLSEEVVNGETVKYNDQLVVTVSGGALTTPKVIDLTDGTNTEDVVILSNRRLGPNESDVYTASVVFKEINKNQDNNQGKSYLGHIDVTQKIETQAASVNP